MSSTNSQLILIAAHGVINSSWAGIRVIQTSVLLSKGINLRFGCHTPNLPMILWQQHLLCRKIVQVISSGEFVWNYLSWNSTLMPHCLSFPLTLISETCFWTIRAWPPLASLMGIRFCTCVRQTPCKQGCATHPLALTPRTRWCGTGDSAAEVPKALLGKLALPPPVA